MGMCNKKRITSELTHLQDHSIHPRRDIFSRFSAGAGLRKNRPTRHRFANFSGREAFVFSVIPLAKVLGNLCLWAEAEELTSPARAKARAAENKPKVPTPKKWHQGGGPSLPFDRERKIRHRSVATRETPIRLPVADEHDTLAGFILGFRHRRGADQLDWSAARSPSTHRETAPAMSSGVSMGANAEPSGNISILARGKSRHIFTTLLG